jgi:signal transduction histidine kinase
VINPLQLAGLLIVLLTMNVLTIVALFCERRAAEEASHSKSMLLATISHDLRTPLNAIIGFADMMRQGVWGPIENQRYRDYIENIHSSGSLLLGMIHDILDRSRLESGKRQINPSLIAAAPIAQSCLDIISPLAAKKRIELRFETDVRGPLFADELALRQILLNLLSNAVKFTPEGGNVVLRLVTAAESGVGHIDVTDTGPGMDEAGQRIALEPFGQIARQRVAARNRSNASDPAGREEEGVGLGLPIVARLAELHGSKLVIKSAPGQGTSMRVNFPGTSAVTRAA